MARSSRPIYWSTVGVATVLVASQAVYAHEEWFADATAHPTQWAQLLRFPQIVAVSVALIAAALLGFLWRRLGRRELLPGPEAFDATPDGRARFYGLVPLILGIHVGTPLIVLGIQGQLLSLNKVLAGPSLYALDVMEIVIGLSVLYGGLARSAARHCACSGSSASAWPAWSRCWRTPTILGSALSSC